MATAKFSIGIVNITDYLRVIARESTNPTAEVFNQVYAPPHPTTRNIEVDNLNPVPHIFDFYESPDGIATGTLLATFEIDVGLIMLASMTIYSFVVGRGAPLDPAVNDTAYNNPQMIGLTEDQVVVMERGIGPRDWDEIELLDTGGFQFKAPSAETFANGDRWTIVVANKIETNATVVSKSIYADVVEFSADVAIDNTYYNKLLEANGATANILNITFPALSGIPDDTIFGVNTHVGSQRYVAIIMDGTDRIRFMGTKDKIWLGKGENIMFIKKGAYLKQIDYYGDYRRVGEIVKGDIAPINGVPETGGWYPFADYPRFYYEYVAKIPSGQLASVTDINNNIATARAKFAIDNVNSKFWMPDSGGYVDRNVDPNGDVDIARAAGTRYTGTIQMDQVGEHDHEIPTKFNGGSGGPDWAGQQPTGGTQPKTAKNAVDASKETRMKNRAVNSWRII